MQNARKPSVEVGPWDQEVEQVASPLVVELQPVPRKQVTFTPRKNGDASFTKARPSIKSSPSPRRDQERASGLTSEASIPKKRPEALRLERVVSERRRIQKPLQVAKFAVIGDGDAAAAKKLRTTEGHPYGLGLGGLSLIATKAEQFRSPRNSPKTSSSFTPRKSSAWRPPLFTDSPLTPNKESRPKSAGSHQDLFIASSFSFRSLRFAESGSAQVSVLKQRRSFQEIKQHSSSETKRLSSFQSVVLERSSDDEELRSEDYENEERKSLSIGGVVSPQTKRAFSSPLGSVKREVVNLRNDDDSWGEGAVRRGVRELSGESSGAWEVDVYDQYGEENAADAYSRPYGPNLAAAFGRSGIGVGVEREKGTRAGRDEERTRKLWGEMRKRSYVTKQNLQLDEKRWRTQRQVASGSLRGVMRAGGSQATTIEEGATLVGVEAQRFALAGRNIVGHHEDKHVPFLPTEPEQSPRRARRRMSEACAEEAVEVKEEEEGGWWTRHPSQEQEHGELEVESDVLLQCRKIRQFLFTCLALSEDPEAEHFQKRWDTFIMSAKERMQAVEAAWHALDFTPHYLPDLLAALVPDLHPRRMARNDCDQVMVLLKKALHREEQEWWEGDPLLDGLRGRAEAVAAEGSGGRYGLSTTGSDQVRMVEEHVQRVGVLRGICILHFLLAVLASPLVPDHYVPEGKLRTIWLKTCLVLKMEATVRLFIASAEARTLPVDLDWVSEISDEESEEAAEDRSEDWDGVDE